MNKKIKRKNGEAGVTNEVAKIPLVEIYGIPSEDSKKGFAYKTYWMDTEVMSHVLTLLDVVKNALLHQYEERQNLIREIKK